MCFSLYTAAVTDEKPKVSLATQRGYRGGSPTAVQA